jgi:hypothetical protein
MEADQGYHIGVRCLFSFELVKALLQVVQEVECEQIQLRPCFEGITIENVGIAEDMCVTGESEEVVNWALDVEVAG